jgi:hypothetical protein
MGNVIGGKVVAVLGAAFFGGVRERRRKATSPTTHAPTEKPTNTHSVFGDNPDTTRRS